jgi:predicted ATPase/class 3 adenylate cyclase/Tfp pilus assembly protein PilF
MPQPNRANTTVPTGRVTILFTDIEGSTALWESAPELMRPALARHDEIARQAVEQHCGILVKTTGDGIHAVFADPLDAIRATIEYQRSLAEAAGASGMALTARCGLHAGISERRDNDVFGPEVNRAARIMSAGHGGQVLLSHAVATLLHDRLPAEIALRDLGAVRLRGIAKPERIYQLMHPALRDSFPALRSLEATPNNLPHPLTSFVGRARELADVADLVRSTRLVTLCGAGGIGKTRLSLQVAADVLNEFADGVWLAELAPFADARLVPSAVAAVLGVKEQAGRPILETLAEHVVDRQLLLILDNCEHVVSACAHLAKRLLQAGPGLRILASSREPMRVAGETTYPVPTLGVPSASQNTDPDALNEYESIRLFVDRAVAVKPGFKLVGENAVAIVDICRHLDGIPFAIELAAARVRMLSVAAIAARLGDRFRLLTGGERTASPRQQTLRALIDWSYDLLSEDERRLLRRLGVFPGSWTLDAAEAVDRVEGLDQADTLDLLSALVEKSLVAPEADGMRYRLLESIREYALERLHAAGEDQTARSRHLAFYLALAERAELGGPAQAEWLQRLDLERENLLSALAWCDHAEDGAESGLRLVHEIKLYWTNRGLVNLGHRLTVEALGRLGASERGLVRCRGLFDAGQFCALMGRYGDAQVHLAESLAIARELGDKTRVAAVLQPLAMASLGKQDFVAARAQLDEALALARELGNPRDVAAALTQFAALHRMQGDLDTAGSLYQEAHALATRLHDQESVAITLLNLAMVAVAQGSSDRAQQMLLDVMDIAAQMGSKALCQSAADVSAGLAATRAEWERAARFFGVAEAQTALTGLHRDAADEAFLAPLMARAREELGDARFSAAEAAGGALGYEDAVRETRSWLAARIAG